MEFVAKLDDQISAPAETAAASLAKTGTATKALDAQLRALDAAQQRSARRAQAQAKAFDPKAYQDQIKAEHELAAAKEAALQNLGLGLSAKEKTDERNKANAARRSEQERAAAAKDAIAATAKHKTAVTGLASAAKGAAFALLAAAGASSAMSVAKIAIGYQGMARLQMISYRASLNFRSLFRGVDSRPLDRSLLRLTDLLNIATPTGRALSGLGTRAFNGLFRAIEKATPLVEALAQGVVLAGLHIENAWLRARIALVPLTAQIDLFSARSSVARVGAVGTALALGLIAVKATLAAAPFLVLASAILAVSAAFEQASKLADEWDWDVVKRREQERLGVRKTADEQMADQLNQQVKEGVDEKALAESRRRILAERAQRKKEQGKVPAEQAMTPAGGAGKEGAPAAKKNGEQIGQGVADGMRSKVAEVEAAGGELGRAADRGVKAAAEIRSPSRVMKRDARYMGEGLEQGLEESEPRVQAAAEKALVPKVAGANAPAPAASPRATPAGAILNFDFRGAQFGGASAADVQSQVEAAMALVVQLVASRLGVA